MPHRAYPGRNQRAKQNAQVVALRAKYPRKKKKKKTSAGKSGGAAIGGAAG